MGFLISKCASMFFWHYHVLYTLAIVQHMLGTSKVVCPLPVAAKSSESTALYIRIVQMDSFHYPTVFLFYFVRTNI